MSSDENVNSVTFTAKYVRSVENRDVNLPSEAVTVAMMTNTETFMKLIFVVLERV